MIFSVNSKNSLQYAPQPEKLQTQSFNGSRYNQDVYELNAYCDITIRSMQLLGSRNLGACVTTHDYNLHKSESRMITSAIIDVRQYSYMASIIDNTRRPAPMDIVVFLPYENIRYFTISQQSIEHKQHGGHILHFISFLICIT